MSVSDDVKELYKKTSDSTVNKNYILDIDGITYDNENIVFGSFSLTEKLCSSEQLRFGECNASMLKLKMVADIGDISEKKIVLSQAINENSVAIGKFNVDSCVLTENKQYRDIVAYDNIIMFNTNVSDWYNSLEFPIKMNNMLISLCAYIGVEMADIQLINGEVDIEKTINPEEMKGITVLKSIAELNGGFFRATTEGKLEFVTLNTSLIDDYLEVKHYRSLKTENYTTDKITRLVIRTEEDDIGASAGEGDNAYVIQDNFLLYGSSIDKLKGIAETIYESVKDITYIPYTAEHVGLPYLKCGSQISYELVNGESFVGLMLQRTLSGTQVLKDAVKSTGTKNTKSTYGAENDVIKLKNRINRLKRTIEETNLVIENLEDNLTNEIKQTDNELSVLVKKIAQLGDTGVTDFVVMYAMSDASDQAPSEGWSEGRKEWVNGKYIWQKTITTYGNGEKYESNAICVTGSTGEPGTNGLSIVDTYPEFYVSTSKTTLTDGSWSTTLPTWSKDKYVWTRSKIIYSDGTYSYGTPVCDASWEVANNIQAELSLKINKKDLISEINAAADVIRLLSNRLIIESTYFKLDDRGEIECTGGVIGGFSISDKLTSTISGVYIDPSSVEINKIKNSINGNYTLTTQEKAASDLNADGSVTIKDLLLAQKIALGVQNYSDCAGARTSSVTIEINPRDPKKLIKLSGTNAWGRKIEQYFGINGTCVGNVLAGAVTGDIIQTSAGVDLDDLNNNIANIGKIYESSQTINLINTWGTGSPLTISEPGYYLLIFSAYSTVGAVRCGAGSAIGNWTQSSGAYNIAYYISYNKITSSTTFKVYTYQGFTTSATPINLSIKAIKIGNV